ncbi:MAG TPA: DUF3048 domain-containing protein [Candidatus Acidoferrales bacterium]|nr:DUF3048 domain-containing protein [Candidatus Acidoferrales bacterium]
MLVLKRLRLIGLHKQFVALAAGSAVLLPLVGAAAYFFVTDNLAVHARLAVSNPLHVRVLDPIVVRFDQPVDTAHVQVGIYPATAVQLQREKDRFIIYPTAQWQAAQRYRLILSDVPNYNHTIHLRGWTASFLTQPRVSVAAFRVDGQPVDRASTPSFRSRLTIEFTAPMQADTVNITLDGKTLPSTALAWAPGGQTVDVRTAALKPYQPVKLGVQEGGYSSGGDPITEADEVSLTPWAVMPSNSGSGITPGFTAVPPIMIVVENSGPSRPQAGLQQADIVFEYVSEYQISRMTATYFNTVPGLVGNVRSCRPINPVLAFPFHSITMCSGASVGTLSNVFGIREIPGIPVAMNDFDHGNHFFRTNTRPAPYNVYTAGDRAQDLRSELNGQVAEPNYFVDPPHEDVLMGDPTDAPSVPAHSVYYSYDGGSHHYLRFDHGARFVDAGTGGQLQVENVVVVHCNIHDPGYVEDESGGAHSVWYDLDGEGPAEIYSDGRLVHATYHLGSASVPYYRVDTPMWFSDPAGNPMALNTGLTWIHVVGNGQ